MGDVPRDDGQIEDERRGGDLLVERILRVRDTQAAPDLRHVGIERENRIAEALGDSREPALQRGCLVFITAVPQLLDAAAELADGDGRDIKRHAFPRRVAEERAYAGIRPRALP
jgi:hypothetical protein